MNNFLTTLDEPWLRYPLDNTLAARARLAVVTDHISEYIEDMDERAKLVAAFRKTDTA